MASRLLRTPRLVSQRQRTAGAALLRHLFLGAGRARQSRNREPEHRRRPEERQRLLCADRRVRIRRHGLVDRRSLPAGPVDARTIRPSSPAFAWRTASARCRASTGSTRCSTSSTRTSTPPTRAFSRSRATPRITTLQVANAALRKEIERSIEGKLILSSNVKGWNISENFIAEKAVNESEPWEFGYALAASRPLALVGQQQGAASSAARTSPRARSCSAAWARATASVSSRPSNTRARPWP